MYDPLCLWGCPGAEIGIPPLSYRFMRTAPRRFAYGSLHSGNFCFVPNLHLAIIRAPVVKTIIHRVRSVICCGHLQEDTNCI